MTLKQISEVAEWKRLREAATKGPVYAVLVADQYILGTENSYTTPCILCSRAVDCDGEIEGVGHKAHYNAAYIAHAYNSDLPAICEKLVEECEAKDDVIDNLGMLVRRLVRKCTNPTLSAQAEDYLLRKGLIGSPLRVTTTHEAKP